MSNLTQTLQQILDSFTSDGRECGCQLAIYQEGECVVNISSGWTTPQRTQAITNDSLFPIYSVGKGLFHTACHRLVEKGALSYNTRIGDLWPEFDNHGKEKIELWHVMSHQTGLHVMPDVTCEQMADWAYMVNRMAQATPAWNPGTQTAYQGLTLTWNLGEPMCRATGKLLRQILLDEVLIPLHLEKQLYFGVTPDQDERIVPVDLTAMPDEKLYADIDASIPVRRGCLPSFNGYGTALGIAQFYNAMDQQFLAPDTLANALIYRRNNDVGIEAYTGWDRFGLGYALIGPKGNMARIFGHGGALGSEGFLDRERHLAVGFAKNKPLPTSPIHAIRDAISDALEEPHRAW